MAYDYTVEQDLRDLSEDLHTERLTAIHKRDKELEKELDFAWATTRGFLSEHMRARNKFMQSFEATVRRCMA